ncbi:MAG: hypothetical protein C4308_06100 [Chitinophagaceae bacterium]
MARKDIIQELNELGTSLKSLETEKVYTVPEGYFEGLATEVLAKIKAEEFIQSLPKQNPYTVPAGYFEGLEEQIMNKVRDHADYQTAKEEIESLSPLLSSINKKPVFSVPENYFENLPVTPPASKGKIVSISVTKTKWFRLAVAAMIAGVVLTAALFVFNSPSKIDPVKNPHGWVAKNLKKVDKDDLAAFVELAVPEAEKESAKTDVKALEIKELLQEVPQKEIEEFINETAASYGENAEDIMLN